LNRESAKEIENRKSRIKNHGALADYFDYIFVICDSQSNYMTDYI